MVTEIGEQIEVDAIFNSGQLNPVSFIWHNRTYKIKKINGQYQDYVGRYQRFYYAVDIGTSDVFEISFSTEDMLWELLRIHNN